MATYEAYKGKLINTTSNKADNIQYGDITVASALDNSIEKDIVSDEWDSSKTYTVNSYCIYDNKLWKCKTQNIGQTPSENTYWTKVSIANEINILNNGSNEMFNENYVTRNAITTNISSKQNVAICSFTVQKTGLYIFRPYFRATVPANSKIIYGVFTSAPAYGVGAYEGCISHYGESDSATNCVNGFNILNLVENTTYYIYAYNTGSTALSLSAADWFKLYYLK